MDMTGLRDKIVKISGVVRNAQKYVNEKGDDPLMRWPHQKPPLNEQLDEAINLINAILDDLEVESHQFGMYDAGAMYSDDLSRGND